MLQHPNKVPESRVELKEGRIELFQGNHGIETNCYHHQK